MTIGELADVMHNSNDLVIEFWDENMSMLRTIEQDNLQRFIDHNFNWVIHEIYPENYVIRVRLS
jgi:hypothetical protein